MDTLAPLRDQKGWLVLDTSLLFLVLTMSMLFALTMWTQVSLALTERVMQVIGTTLLVKTHYEWRIATVAFILSVVYLPSVLLYAWEIWRWRKLMHLCRVKHKIRPIQSRSTIKRT